LKELKHLGLSSMALIFSVFILRMEAPCINLARNTTFMFSKVENSTYFIYLTKTPFL
jgi:hypothetical protein